MNPEKTYLLQSTTVGDSPIVQSNAEPHLESPILAITNEMRTHAHTVLGKKGCVSILIIVQKSINSTRYDPTSYYEETVNWGDMDAFK